MKRALYSDESESPRFPVVPPTKRRRTCSKSPPASPPAPLTRQALSTVEQSPKDTVHQRLGQLI
jgi:hypothetical protein